MKYGLQFKQEVLSVDLLSNLVKQTGFFENWVSGFQNNQAAV